MKFKRGSLVEIVDVTGMMVSDYGAFRMATSLEKHMVLFEEGRVLSTWTTDGALQYIVSICDGRTTVRVHEYGLVALGPDQDENKEEEE